MAWMPKRNSLDQQQLKALNRIADGGNNFVTGDPGTGKSVVLAHAAKEWRTSHPSDKICAITYTNALVAYLEADLSPMNITTMTVHRFIRLSNRELYDLVLVDEAQDLEIEWAKDIKRFGRRVAFFGDFGQALYEGRADRGVLDDMFNTHESLDLGMDYRLPLNIRKLVKVMFPDRQFSSEVYRLMANAQIPLFHAKAWNEEMDFVIRKAKAHAVAGSPVAVLFEAKKRIFRFFYTVLGDDYKAKVDLDTINDELKRRNLPFRFLGNGIGDLKESNDKPLTYVMTWHSSKGLDFETVILPDLSRSMCRDNPFYVAMTRATRNLILSYSGSPNNQIKKAMTCEAVCPITSDKYDQKKSSSDGAVQGSLF